MLLLALLLVPVLLLGGREVWRAYSHEPVFPGLAVDKVAAIELCHEDQLIQLQRDGADWRVTNAANAPGDTAKINIFLKQLGSLKGEPMAPAGPSDRSITLTLADAAGKSLGEAKLGAGEAWRADGKRVQLLDHPALPLWASAWSTLKAPRIAADKLADAQWLTADGAKPMTTEQIVAVGQMLGGLSAWDFVGGDQVNWAGARQLRAILVNGGMIDIQMVPDGKGQSFVRLTSDDVARIRASRGFAFRTDQRIP